MPIRCNTVAWLLVKKMVGWLVYISFEWTELAVKAAPPAAQGDAHSSAEGSSSEMSK